MLTSLEDTVVTSKDAIWCDLKDEVVILDMTSGVYFGLEGVGPHIWEYIQVPHTVAAVVDHLTSVFEVDQDLCRDKTLAFVEELAQRKLLTVTKANDS